MEFDYLKYYDISPLISESTAVFPGDTPFSRKTLCTFEEGGSLELSTITTSLHIGAHADAPSHYHSKGVSIDHRDLSYYCGRAQVVSLELPKGKRISPSDIEGVPIEAPRVLFCTQSFPDPNLWNSDFNSLSVELVDYLASVGVKLIGIDTPSVDPEDSKLLEAHNQIFFHDMAVLEGLILSQVPEGIYQLIALPLRIQSGEASPVRAILLR